MQLCNQKARPLNDKSEIPKDKLADEELDKIVAETSAELSRRRRREPLDGNDSRPEACLDHEQRSTGESQAEPQDQLQLNRLAQPKRPMNAFMVWGQSIRRELHNRYTNVQNAMLSKALGRVWKQLDLEEKKPYIERASLIKANHKRDYPNYRYQPRRIQEKQIRNQQETSSNATVVEMETNNQLLSSGGGTDASLDQSSLGPIATLNLASHENHHQGGLECELPYRCHASYAHPDKYAGQVGIDQGDHLVVNYSHVATDPSAVVYYSRPDESQNVTNFHTQVCHGQNHQSQSAHYQPYGQQAVMSGENQYSIHDQSDLYHGLEETGKLNDAIHHQNHHHHHHQQHQQLNYHPRTSDETMYYLSTSKMSHPEEVCPLQL